MRAKRIVFLSALTVVLLGLYMVFGSVLTLLALPQVELGSTHVAGPLPITNPKSPLWQNTQPEDVQLAGQTLVLPMRQEPLAEALRVKSLNNGTHIAFLIQWPDPTKNSRTVKTEEFRDAVAIMLARPGELPPIWMGNTTTPVSILHWKADWQADMDEGFQDVQTAFPNFWVDVYPNAVGEPPYSLPEAFPEEAKLYMVGWKVGNPLSQPFKATPVEENVAKGFGTIATQPHQDAIGRGDWENEQWQVVIARKLDTGDPLDPRIVPNAVGNVAFAVWDGASGDVGARKSISNWVTLKTETPTIPAATITPPPATTITVTPPPVTVQAPPATVEKPVPTVAPAAPALTELTTAGAVIAVIILAAALLVLLVSRRSQEAKAH